MQIYATDKRNPRLHPSDTLGVDLAEHINQIRARVSVEVHGATGKGME